MSSPLNENSTQSHDAGSAQKATSTTASRRAAERRFELGLYAYHRGEYSLALKEFEKSSEAATVTKDHARFIESCTYILRILAEREEFDRISKIELRIVHMISALGPNSLSAKLKSRALYILGICSCYQDTKHTQALYRFKDSLDFAIKADDKEALANPIYGTATVLYAERRYQDALKELDRLAILLSCLDLPDMRTASYFLTSQIRRNLGDIDGALESAWKAFDSLKHHPHLVLYLNTLIVLGNLYQAKGDEAKSRLYLDLAERTLRREEFPRVARLLDDAFASMAASQTKQPDLTFDRRMGVLVEKNKGEVRFEGQFVLRDLLRVFLENPGKVFTKEDLARLVWREAYEPRIHDNKIYVTIKRLRKLLEHETVKTEYILRAKNGYFLSPKTCVVFTDQAPESLS